jgi:hypothetical protein
MGLWSNITLSGDVECGPKTTPRASGPWGCDTTVVQYNEVSGMKGTLDAEGYDSDYNSRGTCFSV